MDHHPGYTWATGFWDNGLLPFHVGDTPHSSWAQRHGHDHRGLPAKCEVSPLFSPLELWFAHFFIQDSSLVLNHQQDSTNTTLPSPVLPPRVNHGPQTGSREFTRPRRIDWISPVPNSEERGPGWPPVSQVTPPGLNNLLQVPAAHISTMQRATFR